MIALLDGDGGVMSQHKEDNHHLEGGCVVPQHKEYYSQLDGGCFLSPGWWLCGAAAQGSMTCPCLVRCAHEPCTAPAQAVPPFDVHAFVYSIRSVSMRCRLVAVPGSGIYTNANGYETMEMFTVPSMWQGYCDLQHTS
eukprot:1161844-Pelagomonas_calceolata.AAC.3